ncbi:MAG: leucine-rich repeat domain-containing protein [Faecalibacterium sp.]|nr:leucine-rich repeat domain-containing protein [Ruminococcus sp.]MCM1392045.1 leucine-rich repeat domain-containing protein [Ruminococcus sp.]MCM1485822.1 leucine-rich repeat domain-containing protein [Faecalibacterium sp.]
MKNQLKKLVALLMALIMLLIYQISAIAVEVPITSGQCGENVYWSFDRDTGILNISGNGDMNHYHIIKNKIDDDNNVYEWISDVPWSEFIEEITSVNIENGVTNIGGRAFYKHYSIESVNIPESVVYIGGDAFSFCFNLKSVEMSDNVLGVGENAFFFCKNLQSVRLSESLTYLPEQVFYACVNLQNINIPEKITEFGFATFDYCVRLKDITLPKTYEKSYYSFGANLYLDKIVIEGDNTKFSTDEFLGTNTGLSQNIYIMSKELDITESSLGMILGDVVDATPDEVAEMVWQLAYIAIRTQMREISFEETNMLSERFDEWESQHMKYYDEAIANPNATIYCYKESKAAEYAKERGIKCVYFDDEPQIKRLTDENSGVEVIYNSNAFDDEVNLVVNKSISSNAMLLFGNNYSRFTAFDISFELSGEKVQPKEKITVKIPIPQGYDVNSVVVYHMLKDGTSERIDSKYENGFIIFEADSFSEYVFADGSSQVAENPSETCSHICHKTGFLGFVYKLIRIFWKLFRTNQICACGAMHY